MAPVRGLMTSRGVAVGAGGGVDGLPDIPLLGGAAVGAEDVLEAVLFAAGADDGAVGFAVGGDGDFAEVAFADEGVGVVIEVDVLVGVEVDGVGAGGPGAVVEVGVEDLGGEGLPAAGAAAEGGAGPALADAAVLLFDGGDELFVDGGAVGAEVGGVDGVGVVVVGVGVLDVEEEDVGEAAGGPVLEEFVTVTGAAELGAFEAGGGRGGEEGLGSDAGVVVVLVDDEGIVGVGMLVEARRGAEPRHRGRCRGPRSG